MQGEDKEFKPAPRRKKVGAEMTVPRRDQTKNQSQKKAD